MGHRGNGRENERFCWKKQPRVHPGWKAGAGGSRALNEVFVEVCCSPSQRHEGVGLLWLEAILKGFSLSCDFPPYTGRISRPSSTFPFPWLSWLWREYGSLISSDQAEVEVLKRTKSEGACLASGLPSLHLQQGPHEIALILQVRKLRQRG